MGAGLIGRKRGMSQLFLEDGRRLPVTVLEVGPCTVVATKDQEKHGYNAVQLGFEEQKPSRTPKPQREMFGKANITPKAVLHEFRVEDPTAFQVGQALTVAEFAAGAFVDITGKSVGKGFAGAMKRWGFGGGRASHGAHKVHRSVGSIGQCQSPSRVFKNKKMAGHMGQDTRTVQNLEVALVDAEKNLLVVKGSVPGSKGTVVFVRSAIKK